MEDKIQQLKEKIGLNKIPMFNKEDHDYSKIDPSKWYYVQGDGGMLGKEVMEKHIAMCRVITWSEHKRQQREFEKWLKERRCTEDAF